VTSSMTLGTPGGARVLDFRRRGAPPRRRRPSLLAKLVRPLVVALVLVALPLGVAAWVVSAPRFELRDLVIEKGGRRVSETWVRQALAPFQGKNLVLLSLAEVTERLERNPWIASVEVEKELPDRLEVGFSERRPVALLQRGSRLVYADAEGEPIAPVATPAELEEARRAGLLVVSFAHPQLRSGGVGRALAVAGELGRVQPDWAAKLSRIEVLGDEDFRLHTAELPFPLLVRRGEVAVKVQPLEGLLPEMLGRYPKIDAVDLRFSRRIVVQPAAAPREAGGTGA
jgi:cell division septal protein FtsQ